MLLCPLTFTFAHQHFGMVFSDDKLQISKPFPQIIEINKMLSMGKEIKSQLKIKLKTIYKYSEFFNNVTLQMTEAQKYPYSFQSLCSIIVARMVVKVEPAWNPKFSKRVPYTFEEINDLVDVLYGKYLKINKQNEYKSEQKENKIMTVQVDIKKGKVINSEIKQSLNPLRHRYYKTRNFIGQILSRSI